MDAESVAGPWPRVTVVTPSYNQGQFLERTLRSVLTQDYPELEFFVLDGGSTDRSPEIIRSVADQLAWHAIGPDGGQSAAIETGWSRATGDLICWLNSDDAFFPGALRKAATVFMRRPETVMLCGTIAITDEQDHIRSFKKPPHISARHLLPWGRVPGQPGVFLRREVYERVGGPRRDLHYVMDWELWLRIALAYPESRIAYTDDVLAGSREWGQTKTMTASGRDAGEVRKVLAEIFARPDLPAELRKLEKPAYARTWWRQSRQEARARNRRAAARSLAKAFRTAPLEFGLSNLLKQALRIVAPGGSSRSGADLARRPRRRRRGGIHSSS